MSSADLERSLRVIVCATNSEGYRGAIQGLGHTVVGSYKNSDELIGAVHLIDGASPDLVIADVTDIEVLRRMNFALVSRFVGVPPYILVSDNFAGLVLCEEAEFVYGACSTLGAGSDDFRAVVFFAIVGFQRQARWRLEATQATEQVQHLSAIHRATVILHDCLRLPTMTAAYTMLQQNAASRNTVSRSMKLHQYAQDVIAAHEMFLPKGKDSDKK